MPRDLVIEKLSAEVAYLRTELAVAKSDAVRWASRVKQLEMRARRAAEALEGRDV